MKCYEWLSRSPFFCLCALRQHFLRSSENTSYPHNDISRRNCQKWWAGCHGVAAPSSTDQLHGVLEQTDQSAFPCALLVVIRVNSFIFISRFSSTRNVWYRYLSLFVTRSLFLLCVLVCLFVCFSVIPLRPYWVLKKSILMNRFGLVYSDHIWCASWDGFGSLFSGHARVTQFWRLGFAVPCNGHTDNSVRMDWICLATQITQFWWINWNCYCLVTQFLWISWVCYSLVTQTTQSLWINFVTLWSHKLLNAGGIHVAATSDKTEVIRCNTRPLWTACHTPYTISNSLSSRFKLR